MLNASRGIILLLFAYSGFCQEIILKKTVFGAVGQLSPLAGDIRISQTVSQTSLTSYVVDHSAGHSVHLLQGFQHEFLSVKSVTNYEKNEPEIVLYPVPVDDYLRVLIPNGSTFDEYEVIVYSVDGKEVAKGIIKGNNDSMDLSALSSGYYEVQIRNESNHQLSQSSIIKK
ncbi:MAG: T9SS type A sorting domain-containing protein [Cyclobacteriaceae bacterium]